MAESNGVLVAATMKGIIRSTDNGENWALVDSEGIVAYDVKQIKGGFAAITSSSASNTRRLRTSYDGGKTWQPIDAGLEDDVWRTWNDRPAVQAYMTIIMHVGENFYCSHPDGIFRSSDKGRTWKLLLPSVQKKAFRLFVSGNVIYAIRSKGGC
ncbi:WD40/YVTN/BNR-like repeat-containing protein [Puia sp. P3]|uniref:WD40/YVTN/BNR-like repeat-containing protein n=1 Tax=Puia sp. P3 TaxID=3423952 RepID=UPI003D66E6BC